MSLDRPNFLIVGAMKCATTTLHDQLALQSGVCMSDPKEPNFFSDDDAWGRGFAWYETIFAHAGEGDLCGESSTHYTKLPTYPHVVDRVAEYLPDVRVIYVMRDPIDRLVSQYIHEWSRRVISCSLDDALAKHPELVDYSRYAMQLEPWLDRLGAGRVLPVFLERLMADPDREFARVCRYLELPPGCGWHHDVQASNVSSRRSRYGPLMERLLSFQISKVARRALIPGSIRERLKSRWRMEQRPSLSDYSRGWCEERLDPDMARLGGWLGLELSCRNFREAVSMAMDSPEWGSS